MTSPSHSPADRDPVQVPRPAMLLAPQLPAIAARPAATILLLRDLPAGQGFEVLMTRRSEHARFASNAYVFPGGGI